MMANKMVQGIQVRTQGGDYQLHIQAAGPLVVNRDYGWAGELRAPQTVIDWVQEQEPTHQSQASESMYYIRVDVLVFSDGGAALLIHGEEANHPKGMILGCSTENHNVKQLTDFAFQIGDTIELNYIPSEYESVSDFVIPEKGTDPIRGEVTKKVEPDLVWEEQSTLKDVPEEDDDGGLGDLFG